MRVNDQLDERKVKILNAIIQNYLETGEPVGSRTISKIEDMNISSATIRNEMSDLEDMGYILQPHTSAGRIPSDKGYRFYVDQLMQQKEQEISDMQSYMIEHTEKMETVLKQVAKLLATNTNYTTMITAPKSKHATIKFIQLSSINDEQLLAVIVLGGNVVRNKIIDVEEMPDQEMILKLNILLNSALNGLSSEQITLETIAKLKTSAGDHSVLISQIMDAVGEVISEGKELEIYTSGATNIFKYPELSTSESASDLINVLEEKNQLVDFVNEIEESGGDETGIQVYIGNESPMANMKDCSIVTATYNLGDDMKGMVGIIGPKRMDYKNVMENLKTLRSQIDDIFHKEEP
ncbi:MAG: heat-inducible transcriptional repressor HrcA [Eubacterium sp.]|nr:heat-inducible transcriptional repressor HrcA [Eubacterium sp.]